MRFNLIQWRSTSGFGPCFKGTNPGCRTHTKITLFKTVVLRLHGFERENMERKTKGNWDQLVATKDDDLKNISKIIMDLAGQGADVFVNVNNHYEGSAPLTIERIQKIISI